MISRCRQADPHPGSVACIKLGPGVIPGALFYAAQMRQGWSALPGVSPHRLIAAMAMADSDRFPYETCQWGRHRGPALLRCGTVKRNQPLRSKRIDDFQKRELGVVSPGRGLLPPMARELRRARASAALPARLRETLGISG